MFHKRLPMSREKYRYGYNPIARVAFMQEAPMLAHTDRALSADWSAMGGAPTDLGRNCVSDSAYLRVFDTVTSSRAAV
jgi:hypothetical protein